jgi:cardiolipin synthase A/B
MSHAPSAHGGRVALVATALLGTTSYAGLPDVVPDAGASKPVEFETVGGPLADARGEVILQELTGTAEVPENLRAHLVYEQAVNPASPLVLGNKVTLLQNGPATHEAMFAAIRTATDHINLETYIFDAGEVGQQFAELLLERQAAGVRVNVLYDSVGGLMTPQSFFDELRDGGIQVLEFNPVNPLTENRKTWLMNNRDHRKQLVVDGRVAFIGGVNISDSYASSPSGKRSAPKAEHGATDEGWRDTHVQIEGPVVAEFQKLFMETWARQKGPPLDGNDYFPELQPVGQEIVRAIGSVAEDEESPIYLTIVSAISRAEREVHLTVAYFAPDPELLGALMDTARRGVSVKLVLPSHTDSWAIFHLGRSYYTKLLRAGVEIHERHGAVMHAKTAVVDGAWSTIGSSNLDMRSFLHNDEINAVVLSREFAMQMDAMFAADLAESEEILLKEWRRRSVWLRVKERVARLGAYWL